MHTLRVCCHVMAVPGSKERYHHAQASEHWPSCLEVFLEVAWPLVAVPMFIIDTNRSTLGTRHWNVQDIVVKPFRSHCYYPYECGQDDFLVVEVVKVPIK